MHLSHLALAFLVIVIWGFNFVVIRVGLNGIPPLFLAFLRFFLVSFPAIFFLKRPKVPFRKIVVFGLVMFALQFSLFFVGMSDGVSPGLAALLMQLHIFFSVLFAVVFFGEAPHLWQMLGGIVAFAGIWLVGRHFDGDVAYKGLILIVSASALWGAGNILSKKMGKVNMASLIVWGSFVSWPPILCVSLYMEGAEAILSSLKNLTWLSVSCVLYIAYLATLFCFGTWSWLLHHHKVSIVAPLTLLVPVVALISSVLVLGEELYAWKIWAAILIIGGLCINLFGPKIKRFR